MNVLYRDAVPTDRQFILSAWSSSYRKSRDLAFVQMTSYATHMHRILGEVLARPRIELTIACSGADSDLLYGFCATEPGMLFYCYVKQPYRLMGIARGMLAFAGIATDAYFEYAARTETSRTIIDRKPCPVPHARYNSMGARYSNQVEPNV